MQIPVHIKRTADGSVNEWVFIELQGSLESSGSMTGLSGKDIGSLSFNKQGVPILIIGHHALYGKEVALDKPMGVLVKQAGSGTPDAVSMQLTAVVKKKLLFKSRPKPIVTNLPKKM